MYEQTKALQDFLDIGDTIDSAMGVALPTALANLFDLPPFSYARPEHIHETLLAMPNSELGQWHLWAKKNSMKVYNAHHAEVVAGYVLDR